MLLAFPVAYLCHRRPLAYPPVLAGTNIIYAIPSLAMFALLGPFLGYTNEKPIIVAMALYTLVILVRNMVEGLRAVPRSVTDAATGLGYGRFRRFMTVELPLAVPTIIAGLRLATVSTISLITVGGAIGKGALGRMFADAIDRQIPVELWAGVLAVIALALIADLLHPGDRSAADAVDPGRGALMGAIGDGVGWLFDSANWWGARGLVQRIWEQLCVLGRGAGHRVRHRLPDRAADRTHAARPVRRLRLGQPAARHPHLRRRLAAVHLAAADAVAAAAGAGDPRRAADHAQHGGGHLQRRSADP